MPAGRHRKTVPARERARKLGVPTAMTLALATGISGAATPNQAAHRTSAAAATGTPTGSAPERVYSQAASRSLVREEPPTRAEIEAITDELEPSPPEPAELKPRWLTADLNVWRGPGEKTKLLTVLDSGEKVQVTGVVRGAWAQILRGGDRLVWVRKDYLAREKPPETGGAAPVSSSPCPDGSSVEIGLMPNTIAVYRSVCAAFPAVSSWGGRSGSGDHGAGLALDIMVTGSMGDAIAEYVRAHAGELGVSYVIWAQRIWTVERSAEGWRAMEDRGSATANHYDHVHVSVF